MSAGCTFGSARFEPRYTVFSTPAINGKHENRCPVFSKATNAGHADSNIIHVSMESLPVLCYLAVLGGDLQSTGR